MPRKKKVEDEFFEEEFNQDIQDEPELIVEEKPKRKRKTKLEENVFEENDIASVAEPVEEKPKRPRKPKIAQMPVEENNIANIEEPVEEKPKRKRKAKVDETVVEENNIASIQEPAEAEQVEAEVVPEENKKKKKSRKITNIISNCIFVPVMILLVIYFAYSMSILTKNGIPSIFGQSYARVLSDSMTASGFEKGDIVLLQKMKVVDIKVGDIIAFYECELPVPNVNGTKETAMDIKTGEKIIKNRKIIFHKVYNIEYDSFGHTWFYTYGTSKLNFNGDPNSEDIEANYQVDSPTRGDYVIGKYKPSWLAGVLQFISSPMGMIILIIAPCAVLLFTLLLNIIEIIDQMMREKKQKLAMADSEVKERKLDVTTIIEENDDLNKDV